MKVTTELNLTNFDFWSGAKHHEFTKSELTDLEYAFEELFPKGCTDTQINDLFWFEEKFLCEIVGLDYNEYLKR